MPEFTDESWQLLFKIFDFFAEVDSYKETSTSGFIRSFRLFAFGNADYRINELRNNLKNKITPKNDLGIVYSLLGITPKTFTLRWFEIKNIEGTNHKRKQHVTDIQDEIDYQKWQEFEKLRDAFLEKYLAAIDFENTFYTIHELKIDGKKFQLNPNALIIGGFSEFWVGYARDKGAEIGFSDTLYVPHTPSFESLCDFIKKDGLKLWEVLDDSFGKEEDSPLWNFVFNKNAVFHAQLFSLNEDSLRLRARKSIDLDPSLVSTTLVSKLTSHMARLWDMARIIRYYTATQNENLADAFREVYKKQVDNLMASISGEDFFSLVATVTGDSGNISPIGSLPGAEEWGNDDDRQKPDIPDPRDTRISQENNVVDIRAIFTNPTNILKLLEISSRRNRDEFKTFVQTFQKIGYSNEEAFERAILDLAEYPLQKITDNGD